METTRQPKRTPRGHRAGPEPRVVAIKFRPAPRPSLCGQFGVLHQGREWQYAKR